MRRTVLFCPINSAGHMNASLAIADRLSRDHNCHCVFLLIGPPLDEATFSQRGHQLIVLEDREPYEDYELEPGEDPDGPADEQRKLAEGKAKRKFSGAHKWPQMIARNQSHFKMAPIDSIKHSASLVQQITLNNLSKHESEIAAAIERIQPALVVADVYFPPACLLLHEPRRPWVRVHTANPFVVCKSKLPGGVRPPANCGIKLYSARERQRMRTEEPDKWAALLENWRRAQEEVAQALELAYGPVRDWYASQEARLGERLARGQSSISSAHLNVYMYPEALDYDQEADLFEYPERWMRCDSLLREPAGARELAEERWWLDQLEPYKQVIYFSLGSIASANVDLMQRYVAFLGEDHRARTGERLYVVSKGVNGDKIKLAPRSMLGANYLPQGLLLRHTHLAIVHGGNNTVTECLYHGVPMIVLPNFADQSDNAQRVEDLGLGKRLDLYTCIGWQLNSAIEELLCESSSGLRERVRAIGARMRSLDELGKVSDVIGGLMVGRGETGSS